jgi:hypothetical protein
LQPNDVGAPKVLNTVMIDLMAEYAPRIAQDKHASVRRMFHTLKKNLLKTVTRQEAKH